MLVPGGRNSKFIGSDMEKIEELGRNKRSVMWMEYRKQRKVKLGDLLFSTVYFWRWKCRGEDPKVLIYCYSSTTMIKIQIHRHQTVMSVHHRLCIRLYEAKRRYIGIIK